MRQRLLVPLSVVLLGLLVLAVGFESAPRFTGLRWDPGLVTPPKAPPNTGGAQTAEPVRPHHAIHPAAAPVDLFPFALAALLIAAAVLALLIVRWYRRRRPTMGENYDTDAVVAAEDAEPVPDTDQPSAPVLRRAFADALDALDEERIPQDAIVTAWLALQDAAAASGIRRRAAETPTEFTARILQRVPADAQAVDTLLSVYQEVRFGGRTPRAEDVARVRGSLLTLSASWDVMVSSTGSGS